MLCTLQNRFHWTFTFRLPRRGNLKERLGLSHAGFGDMTQGKVYLVDAGPGLVKKAMNPAGGTNDIRHVGRSQPWDAVRSLAMS
jgi:hypothetical protein